MPPHKKPSSVPIEHILADHSPEVQTLVQLLRQIVRQSVPEANESGHASWHSLNYHHPQLGYFCGIFPRQESVDLGFEFGVLLPDPHGLLSSGGRQFRAIPLSLDNPIPEAAIEELLRAAIALPASRAVRMTMVRNGAKPGSPG